MRAVLVDTNVVSYFFRKDSRSGAYEKAIVGHTRCISFMTLAELFKWPIERNFGKRKTHELEVFIHGFAVLPFDDAMARQWAKLVTDLKRKGVGLSFSDSWIAATALRHNLPLVTHNGKHFEKVPGLTLISEDRTNS